MDFETRQQNYETFKSISYYLVIGLISFISVAFLPFISSSLLGQVIWPVGALEWSIWITVRLLISAINIIIFYSFLQQAKINVKDEKNYLLALETLNKANRYKKLKPRSPKRYFGVLWGTKGITLFITSILSSIVLSQAILAFDLASFLSYLFTVFMAVIFGYLQMRSTENYWTSEFLEYANDRLRQAELELSEDKEC